MMSLTIAGTAVLNSLVADLSPELAAMLLATVIGGYTLIGGLGATFYVSYFNTALIFVLILMLVVEVKKRKNTIEILFHKCIDCYTFDSFSFISLIFGNICFRSFTTLLRILKILLVIRSQSSTSSPVGKPQKEIMKTATSHSGPRVR